MSDEVYLIRKGGAYYRPNARGYTTSVIQAGRYTYLDAVNYSHPNGPDGPRDGMSYLHEDEVCCDEDWRLFKELRNQKFELVEALQNILGHINTPISRRKLGIKDQWPEWLTHATETLAKAEGQS